MESTMFNYPWNEIIQKGPQIKSKKIKKKLCFPPLKQCLSGHFMKILKFMSNKLKIYVVILFHSSHVKEPKKNISCNSFVAT